MKRALQQKTSDSKINSNIENARNLVNAVNTTNKTEKREVEIEKYVLDMLDARLMSHNGNFEKALEKFIKKNTNIEKYVEQTIKKIGDKKQSIDDYDIKLLETYYFVKCQIDRANAMIENKLSSIIMSDVAEMAEKIHENLKNSKNSEENNLRIKEFGNIVVIAKWATAYNLLRDFGTLVDKKSTKKELKT